MTTTPTSLRHRVVEFAAAARMRRFGSWTLRARLIAALVAVLLVVCLVIGTVTVLALRSFLVGQLDDRLGAASHRARTYTDDSPLFVATWYPIATAAVTAVGALVGAKVLRF